MAVERTLSIIKPDAVASNISGKINAMFEDTGLRIIAQKKIKMTYEIAEGFYAVHKDHSFFESLCDYMSSGPSIVQIIEGENAIAKVREIMGATNPANAEKGTIRHLYGKTVTENTVHGSDSPESAASEIPYFFATIEIFP